MHARLCSDKNNTGRKTFQALESRVTKIVFVAQQECKQCKMWPPMQMFLRVTHTSRGKRMLTEHRLIIEETFIRGHPVCDLTAIQAENDIIRTLPL